jgi:hypothetical protein
VAPADRAARAPRARDVHVRALGDPTVGIMILYLEEVIDAAVTESQTVAPLNES